MMVSQSIRMTLSSAAAQTVTHMHLSCFSKMGSLRIPDCFKVMPHRLHITLYVRLSRGNPIHVGAALFALLCGALEGGGWRVEWGRTAALLHLGAFATHFGTQIWMTLFSGVVLFFGLPRKAFGTVQRLLFPVYFVLNSALGLVALVTLPPDTTAGQSCRLAVCIGCDLLGAAAIVPCMVRTLAERGRMEEGKEDVDRPRLIASNPEYARLHARFRRLHGLCATANLLAMACNAAHLHLLACRLIDGGGER